MSPWCTRMRTLPKRPITPRCKLHLQFLSDEFHSGKFNWKRTYQSDEKIVRIVKYCPSISLNLREMQPHTDTNSTRKSDNKKSHKLANEKVSFPVHHSHTPLEGSGRLLTQIMTIHHKYGKNIAWINNGFFCIKSQTNTSVRYHSSQTNTSVRYHCDYRYTFTVCVQHLYIATCVDVAAVDAMLSLIGMTLAWLVPLCVIHVALSIRLNWS